jgi:GNAT superfamily N-acetyltransferase
MSDALAQSPAGWPGAIGWEVRRARPDDAPAIAEAVAELLVELGAPKPPDRAAIEAETRAHIDDPSLGIVLVAAADAVDPLDLGASPRFTTDGASNCELIGVVAASWARAIQVPGRMLTIEVLWARREERDRGVGAALVDALAEAAAAEGVARVEVGLPRESFAALRATERFYLANGFERLGPRMRRKLDGGGAR